MSDPPERTPTTKDPIERVLRAISLAAFVICLSVTLGAVGLGMSIRIAAQCGVDAGSNVWQTNYLRHQTHG